MGTAQLFRRHGTKALTLFKVRDYYYYYYYYDDDDDDEKKKKKKKGKKGLMGDYDEIVYHCLFVFLSVYCSIHPIPTPGRPAAAACARLFGEGHLHIRVL